MNKSDYENADEVTKTDETKQKYIARALSLVNKAKKELNIPENELIDPRQFAIWFYDGRMNISKNSFRVYKSSIMYYFVEYLKTDASLEAADYLIRVNSNASYKKSTKTSALKMKKIPEDDLEKLIEYLDSNDSKWDKYIKTWILSTILCGLRPSEWKNAELVTYADKIALKVENAKNTNGRANGNFRILLLHEFIESDLDIVKEQIYNVKSFTQLNEFESFYEDCSSRLNYINNKIFPRRKKNITLYSGRHQFSANMKVTKSKAEVAALMGHAVDSTATLHYGKKMFGSSKGSMVSPIQEQVETVKTKDREYNSEIRNNTNENNNIVDNPPPKNKIGRSIKFKPKLNKK